MQDDLTRGAGEGDVRQAEVLAGLLGVVQRPPLLVPRGLRPADVEHPPALIVVQAQHVDLVRGPPVPGVRHVHDGELQPFADVHGHDLHGRGVGLEAPAAFVGALDGGLCEPPAKPPDQGSDAERLLAGRGMQRLTDVPQVGEDALAVGPSQHPGGQPLLGADHLEQRGDATLGEQLAPAAQPRPESVGQLIAGRVDRALGLAEKHRQCCRAQPPAAVRLLDGLQQRQPRAGAGCAEDVGPPGEHRRYAGPPQGLPDQRALLVGAYQHRDVTGLDRAPAQQCGAAKQTDDVVGHVAGDRLAQRVHLR